MQVQFGIKWTILDGVGMHNFAYRQAVWSVSTLSSLEWQEGFLPAPSTHQHSFFQFKAAVVPPFRPCLSNIEWHCDTLLLRSTTRLSATADTVTVDVYSSRLRTLVVIVTRAMPAFDRLNGGMLENPGCGDSGRRSDCSDQRHQASTHLSLIISTSFFFSGRRQELKTQQFQNVFDASCGFAFPPSELGETFGSLGFRVFRDVRQCH